MTIARNANIRAMLVNYEEGSEAHKHAVRTVMTDMVRTLNRMGYKVPTDDRLAEVEGVISNYLMEAGYR